MKNEDLHVFKTIIIMTFTEILAMSKQLNQL